MKNRLFAAIFAFTLGVFGINNFYCNNIKNGIIDCCVSVLGCWCFGIPPAIIGIINIVRGCQYLWCNTDEEFVSKYCK